RAREQVAALLGCDPDEVIFTSGGTEANNLVIRSVAADGRRKGIVTSAIEHPATARPCAWLESQGHRVTRLGVDAGGRVLLDAARKAIDPETAPVPGVHPDRQTGVLPTHAQLSPLS